ncbi:Laccase-3 [Acorus gramineus]|uniref:laccase n=1 Tax=Acorus gramineus TaxID=55184 RepID=A0AAV9AKI7_ACOGR|nr:Laccase-3 [Acorus gramineus]
MCAGEWWKAPRTGGASNISGTFTINGQPGDLYNCSSSDTVILPVSAGETNLYRVINAAMTTKLFVSIEGHLMTVVATDASYTKPFTTSVIMLGPGQTTDVLVTMNQPAGRYYIAARAYPSAEGVAFDNTTTTTAILEYKSAGCSSKPGPARPAMPSLPAFNDTRAFARGNRSPPKARRPLLHGGPRRAGLRHKRVRSRRKAPTQGTQLTSSPELYPIPLLTWLVMGLYFLDRLLKLVRAYRNQSTASMNNVLNLILQANQYVVPGRSPQTLHRSRRGLPTTLQ